MNLPFIKRISYLEGRSKETDEDTLAGSSSMVERRVEEKNGNYDRFVRGNATIDIDACKKFTDV